MRSSEVFDSRESTSRSLSNPMLQPSDFLARTQTESKANKKLFAPAGRNDLQTTPRQIYLATEMSANYLLCIAQ